MVSRHKWSISLFLAIMKNAVAQIWLRLMLVLLVFGPLMAASRNTAAVFHAACFTCPQSGMLQSPAKPSGYLQVTHPYDRRNESQILPEPPFEWAEDETENETTELQGEATGDWNTGWYHCRDALSASLHKTANGRFAFATTPWYIVIRVFRI